MDRDSSVDEGLSKLRGRVRFSTDDLQGLQVPGRDNGIGSKVGSGDVQLGPQTSGAISVEIDEQSSDEEFTPGLDVHRHSPFIDVTAVFGDGSFGNTDSEYGSGKWKDPYNLDSGGEEQHGEEDNGNPLKKRKKSNQRPKAPEQRITMFALRLALIEKGASQIGTLSFLWATVVILGGFATTVSSTDFWVVTLIILAESSRIFSRSHELEWQQLSIRSDESLGHRFLRAASDSFQHNVSLYRSLKARLKKIFPWAAAPANSNSSTRGGDRRGSPLKRRGLAACDGSIGKAVGSATSVNKPSYSDTLRHRTHGLPPSDGKKEETRTWNASTAPLLPYTHHIVTAKSISRALYLAQLVSALVSIGLAVWRLRVRSFFYISSELVQNSVPNIKLSMTVFYTLSLIEAGLFLLERSYWEYRMRYAKLLSKVNNEAELGPENLEAVKFFFYEVYSQCLKGSVFDGLDMDLVSFSISWLQGEDYKQQLGGARLLDGIVSLSNGKPRNDLFAADCLRRLGTSPGIMERLVEMLSWNSRQEEELVSKVACIICRLVVYNRNCSRIVGIPGSMEAILSLMLPHTWTSRENDASEKFANLSLHLRLNGLRILKYLCKDHKNSLRIGETRGLLSILILFIEVRDEFSFNPISYPPGEDSFKIQMKTYKKSLQVLGLLAAATNSSGGVLRRRIADVVSGLKNLRDMIQLGDSKPELQRTSVEILYHLAMDKLVRKTIGATGGIIRNLFNLFAKYDDVQDSPLPKDVVDKSPDKDKVQSAADKNREEWLLASIMAGRTLTRVGLQNPKNCLKMVALQSAGGKTFLEYMVDFLSRPRGIAGSSPSKEIASSAAQILRSVLNYVDELVKLQVAKECASLVMQQISLRRREGRSALYESFLGLAPQVLECLDEESYTAVFSHDLTKHEFVAQLLRNLKHTPTTARFPRIRRYSLESLIVLSNKDTLCLDTFLSANPEIDISAILLKTLDSISEVENFCLFSGLLGHTRHQEEMEELVDRASRSINSRGLPARPSQ